MTGAGGASTGASKPPDGRDGPVTTTVKRRVKPGHEAFYEEFLAGIIAAVSEFPGRLGVEVFRPESATAGEYRTVYRFDSAEHLCAWLDSEEHAAWMERAEPHAIGPGRTSFVTGLESWFTLPGQKHETPTRVGDVLGGGMGLATALVVALFPFAAVGGGLLVGTTAVARSSVRSQVARRRR